MTKTLLTSILLVLPALQAPAQDQDLVARGEDVFRQCAACHAVGEGARNKVGPVLNDLFGRQAGTLESYNYSSAMVEAGENGLNWTPESFKTYITAPRERVPGTKMTYAGLEDADKRDALTAYLLTFSPDYAAEAEDGDN